MAKYRKYKINLMWIITIPYMIYCVSAGHFNWWLVGLIVLSNSELSFEWKRTVL